MLMSVVHTNAKPCRRTDYRDHPCILLKHNHGRECTYPRLAQNWWSANIKVEAMAANVDCTVDSRRAEIRLNDH